MIAVMRQAHHGQQLRRYHDRNIKETSFNVRDLVLRRIQKTDDMHKLSAPWEGPFIVTEVIKPSTYRLQWGDRRQARCTQSLECGAPTTIVPVE
jgi:hypothetical protein